MRVVIVGFGRVGASVARELLAEGHAVTVIDNRGDRIERALKLAGARVHAGNAVDVQVQRDAGVAGADVFLAVTSNDNVNLVAAQIAIEVFQITHVVARVYTKSRAEVTRARGIVTVCPTELTMSAVSAVLHDIAGRPPAPPRPVAPLTQPAVTPDPAKFVVICGGGRVGFHLARALVEDGHEVALIERDPRVAHELSARLECAVILGDGSTAAALEEAGAARCRAFAAVTGRDEDNLIACQSVRMLAAGSPAPPKTIARVSDPHNEELYRALGVDVTISSTSLIQNVIERELPTLRWKTLLALPGGGMSLVELTLPLEAPVIGRPLRELVLPHECNVVAILRAGRPVVPRGDTAFAGGDVVLALVAKEAEPALLQTLLGASA